MFEMWSILHSNMLENMKLEANRCRSKQNGNVSEHVLKLDEDQSYGDWAITNFRLMIVTLVNTTGVE